MLPKVSRRQFIQGAAAAAAVWPRLAEARQGAPVSPLFRHGVASGDPLPDRVMIWTRVTSPAGATKVTLARRYRRETEQRHRVGDGRDVGVTGSHGQGGRPGPQPRPHLLLRLRCRWRHVGRGPHQDPAGRIGRTRTTGRRCPAPTTPPATSTSTAAWPTGPTWTRCCTSATTSTSSPTASTAMARTPAASPCRPGRPPRSPTTAGGMRPTAPTSISRPCMPRTRSSPCGTTTRS